MDKAKRAGQRKYHYIYKTTCLITDRFYIGMHSTDNLEDRYIGSGKRLWHSINYYGIENHKKEILEFLPDRITLSEREKQIVNEEMVNNPQCMNIALGGGCGWDHVNKIGKNNYGKTTETYKRIGEKIRLKYKNDIKLRKALSEKLKAAYKNGRKLSGCFSEDGRKEMIKRAQSTSAKIKRTITLKNRDVGKGEKNSQYGIKRIGINKNCSIKKVLIEELQKYLDDGWKKGFKEFKKIKIKKERRSRKNWSILICKNCGCEFEASQRDIRRNRRFCGLKCAGKFNKNNR